MFAKTQLAVTPISGTEYLARRVQFDGAGEGVSIAGWPIRARLSKTRQGTTRWHNSIANGNRARREDYFPDRLLSAMRYQFGGHLERQQLGGHVERPSEE